MVKPVVVCGNKTLSKIEKDMKKWVLGRKRY